MIYYIITAIFTGILLNLILGKYFKIKKYPLTVILSIIIMFILIRTFDNQLMIIKGFLFSEVLIFTSIVDFKTRTIPNTVHIVILLLSIININLLQSMLGFIVVPLPFLLAALLEPNSIGGGDIKLMSAIGFLLEVKNGLIAGMISLIIAVAINSILYKLKRKDKSESFPLGLYLSIGSFVSYINI
ncbi:hypothetical protein SH1V18_38610 [Vallitalea longa]|uniref:Prepilin type IV endopeptidase peptidase domain-containing protein n=1 Tax=Vallitalea longa TaxID=2936439 RepID=A0A9W6DFL9_9FIRM|nr:A24 family peptidase [Vallitalea longa]GKX31381.1 hypothetical protein SH1V18_38610 [Vallitalea longa]